MSFVQFKGLAHAASFCAFVLLGSLSTKPISVSSPMIQQGLVKENQPKQEIVQEDQPKQEIVKEDQPKQEIVQEDQPKQEIVQEPTQEIVQEELCKQEIQKEEKVKDEPLKQEELLKQDESPKQEKQSIVKEQKIEPNLIPRTEPSLQRVTSVLPPPPSVQRAVAISATASRDAKQVRFIEPVPKVTAPLIAQYKTPFKPPSCQLQRVPTVILRTPSVLSTPRESRSSSSSRHFFVPESELPIKNVNVPLQEEIKKQEDEEKEEEHNIANDDGDDQQMEETWFPSLKVSPPKPSRKLNLVIKKQTQAPPAIFNTFLKHMNSLDSKPFDTYQSSLVGQKITHRQTTLSQEEEEEEVKEEMETRDVSIPSNRKRKRLSAGSTPVGPDIVSKKVRSRRASQRPVRRSRRSSISPDTKKQRTQ